ncbi:MAG: type II toxin-antitoxin system VapC family toxin [Acidimicrobiales bacterium]
MSRALVLDAEAMAALADRRHARFDEVRAALEAARRLRREVVVSAVTLAELYRAPNRNALVDACLSRETGLVVRDTDRSVARLVGGILHAAGAGSVDLADAHCVACAVEAGGGVVLTGDPRDIGRLAAPYANVHVGEL